ncbi:NAD(P)/FAD-dependent oxidoreductase [Kineococcus rhizosphaerae]|uniref:NADH dehydrogenase n=1 Tax=Kineococcus rhizosphaerae TaxID=559628 RepID=A0A2T0R4I2_9ACTN|nr:FAD-dependent oxidoreductase [Kineococcus rhizosphaerae]PRY15239.1 NADH dehydrogenase [Kineococcus rhizosphaerae]
MRERVPHVLVVGGGHVGLTLTLRLQQRLRRGEARVTLVDARGYMTYRPFLPEVAAGSVEPRNVVVPLRPALPGTDVVTGEVTRVRHADRVATVRTDDGTHREIGYDVLVVAPGSISRTLPVPGLAEHAVGFTTVEQAVHLRDRVLAHLDLAEATDDPAVRARALTFVFVGGGYAGVEALAEVEDMARYALRLHRGLRAADLRFVLVEAGDRILPEVGARLARYAADVLRERGIEVLPRTTLASCAGGRVVLTDGQEFDAATVVWTAGVEAHPVLGATDLPLDGRRRLRVRADLRVEGVESAWGAGDSCAVPDVTAPGTFCAPNAQHAVRQARRLADNLVAVLRGGAPREYRHRHVGSVATLGLHRGVAQVRGLRLRGYPAWLLHRLHHLSRVPTAGRKAGVLLGWLQSALFPRESVSAGVLSPPAEPGRAVRP